jgi:hypothetical protein
MLDVKEECMLIVLVDEELLRLNKALDEVRQSRGLRKIILDKINDWENINDKLKV